MQRAIILIAYNLRSCHNVGSLLRTAEGLGVDQVILCGYTPYPLRNGDNRLPHIARKLHKQISKTALGAETSQPWQHFETFEEVLALLANQGYHLAAVEQAPTAIALPDFRPPEKLALLVGREVEGVEPEVLAQCTTILEIPMFGKKESFNVVQAAAMALYHSRFTPFEA
jgi:23S rRNA (guanosine2251-2'-O)-methyltransferase